MTVCKLLINLMTNPGISGCINLLGLTELFGFPVSNLLPFGYPESKNYGSKFFKTRTLDPKIFYKVL